jgi:hypothetical protein
MREINKQVMLDEHGKPVAVQIAWAEWLKVESALRTMASDADDGEPSEEHGSDHNAGDEGAAQRAMAALWGTMKGLAVDPLDYQRRVRSEWDRAWDAPEGNGGKS